MRFSLTNLTSDIMIYHLYSFMDSPEKGNSLSPTRDPPETIAVKGVYECFLWVCIITVIEFSQSPLFGKLKVQNSSGSYLSPCVP